MKRRQWQTSFNLRLPFHIDSPTFVHLSQFTFNFFFKVLLINTTVHMIFLNLIDLQHQGINLVPFIMLPGNWSELNLVYWNEREKGLQIKTKNKNPVNCHTTDAELCVELLVFSNWEISKTLNDIPVTPCCLKKVRSMVVLHTSMCFLK